MAFHSARGFLNAAFFYGGTIAAVAEKLGGKWIADLGKFGIRGVIFDNDTTTLVSVTAG